jgi:hypothetical protein
MVIALELLEGSFDAFMGRSCRFEFVELGRHHMFLHILRRWGCCIWTDTDIPKESGTFRVGYIML